MMEARGCSDDRESCTKEWRTVEAGSYSPVEPSEGTSSADNLDYSPCKIHLESDLQNYKWIHLCFKSQSLWYFVTVAPRKLTERICSKSEEKDLSYYVNINIYWYTRTI